jgi:hypothetical protein
VIPCSRHSWRRSARWSSEAKHRLVDDVVCASATFEWLEGGHFVVLRSHDDHEPDRDAICVVGRPESGEGLVLELQASDTRFHAEA